MPFPAASRETVITLHWIHPNNVANPTASLGDAERRRAADFVFEKDACHWSAIRAGAKRVLADHLGGRLLDWIEPRGAKPSLAGSPLEFNLSHSDRLGAILISDEGPVGLDIEPLDRAPDLLDCAGSFCHPRELKTLPQAPEDRALALLGLWTAKEALLKALGTGLGFPPTDFFIVADRARGGPPGYEQFRIVRPASGSTGHLVAAAIPIQATGVTCPEHGQ